LTDSLQLRTKTKTKTIISPITTNKTRELLKIWISLLQAPIRLQTTLTLTWINTIMVVQIHTPTWTTTILTRCKAVLLQIDSPLAPLIKTIALWSSSSSNSNSKCLKSILPLMTKTLTKLELNWRNLRTRCNNWTMCYNSTWFLQINCWISIRYLLNQRRPCSLHSTTTRKNRWQFHQLTTMRCHCTKNTVNNRSKSMSNSDSGS